MRIYLNLSVWNRPFDDWSEEKIVMEAKTVISGVFWECRLLCHDTTDGEIIKKRGGIERYLGEKGYELKVVNPLDLEVR